MSHQCSYSIYSHFYQVEINLDFIKNDKDNKTLSELKNTYLQSKTESVDKKESCSQNAPVDDKVSLFFTHFMLFSKTPHSIKNSYRTVLIQYVIILYLQHR